MASDSFNAGFQSVYDGNSFGISEFKLSDDGLRLYLSIAIPDTTPKGEYQLHHLTIEDQVGNHYRGHDTHPEIFNSIRFTVE